MKNTLHLDSADLAEQAGAVIALRVIGAMRVLPSQGERLAALAESIADICDTKIHQHRTIGGFSVVLTAYLDHALIRHPGEASPC